MHGPVDVVLCSHDAFEESRFCVEHIEHYGTAWDKIRLTEHVETHEAGALERLKKNS